MVLECQLSSVDLSVVDGGGKDSRWNDAPRFEDCMSREEALRLYTHGSAWFSNEDDRKGTLSVGSFADLAVLSQDFFTVEPDAIRSIESVLTVVGGKSVYAKENYAGLAPELPPVIPGWSPVQFYGGYNNSLTKPPIHEHTPIMQPMDEYGQPPAAAASNSSSLTER